MASKKRMHGVAFAKTKGYGWVLDLHLSHIGDGRESGAAGIGHGRVDGLAEGGRE